MSGNGHRMAADIRSHLDHPVIDGDGHWVEFDPVFSERMRKVGGDRAADGFRRTVDAHGPDSFGLFSCSKATNEMNFVMQKFARVAIGTNNIDSCNRT